MSENDKSAVEELESAYKYIGDGDCVVAFAIILRHAEQLDRLRAENEQQRKQIIAGIYDAASVGITLIKTEELERLRQELAKWKASGSQGTIAEWRDKAARTDAAEAALATARKDALEEAAMADDNLIAAFRKFVNSQKPLPPEYQRLLDKHLWELYTNNAAGQEITPHVSGGLEADETSAHRSALDAPMLAALEIAKDVQNYPGRIGILARALLRANGEDGQSQKEIIK